MNMVREALNLMLVRQQFGLPSFQQQSHHD